jgi:uncharacterized protein YjbI with pentapeptide repeats
MANEEQLELLKQGVRVWNRARKRPGLSRPDLRGALLKGISLVGADLTAVDLSGADLSEANLTGADLHSADLSYTKLWSAGLSGARLERACLASADLRRANLIRARIVGASFAGAIMEYAVLDATDLTSSNLVKADLRNARVRGANLTNADLSLARLGHAQLQDSVFRGSTVDGTDFNNATMRSTVLTALDLRRAKRLEAIRHQGPSYLGIDTLYLSKGQIPESFLRGCGVPENLIRYTPSLVNSEEGIQFYSCFIAYSSKDAEFAGRLHGRMRDANLRVWYAPEDMEGGKKQYEQIETAIQVYDKLLVVLSDASLRSEWVKTELRNALKAESQTRQRKLFPVRLLSIDKLDDWRCFDVDSGKDIGVELREYHIPDFSNWKDHEAFERSFTRLLSDLKHYGPQTNR